MNLVKILRDDSICQLENRVIDFSLSHNVLSVNMYDRPREWSKHAAIIVYND